jgi:N-acetyl-anhydromuramyl-L-alanine amidase AmpD
VELDKEPLWQEVRRYPSACLAELCLRIQSELHRRATQDHLRRAESQHPKQRQPSIKPEAVVLHHSDGSYRGGVEWIANPASKVSYHVLISRDGRRTVFANDTDRCWHAGKSNWMGRPDLNSWSLGLAWEGNTYEYPLGEDAMASAIEYLVPRMRKWGIPMNMVVTHQQVAPTRKTDISPGDAARFKTRLKASL